MSAIQSVNIPTSAEGRGLRMEQRAALRERLFQRLDTDGSGGVSRQEFATARQNLPGAGQSRGMAGAADRIGALLTRLDGDGDGQVSRAKLDAAMARRTRPAATEDRPLEDRGLFGLAGALLAQLIGQERRAGSTAEQAQARQGYASAAARAG